MRDSNDDRVMSYIDQENRYAVDQLQRTAALEAQLYEEFQQRTPSGAQSIPVVHNEFVYYAMYNDEQDYELWYRNNSRTG
jgi:protease II